MLDWFLLCVDCCVVFVLRRGSSAVGCKLFGFFCGSPLLVVRCLLCVVCCCL